VASGQKVPEDLGVKIGSFLFLLRDSDDIKWRWQQTVTKNRALAKKVKYCGQTHFYSLLQIQVTQVQKQPQEKWTGLTPNKTM